MNQSLNDKFVNYQIIKAEVLAELKKSPGEVQMKIADIDEIISTAIFNAIKCVYAIKSAFESGKSWEKKYPEDNQKR